MFSKWLAPFPCRWGLRGAGGGGGQQNVIFHLSPQCSGFSRALILRKSLFPLIPVGVCVGRRGGIQMNGA